MRLQVLVFTKNFTRHYETFIHITKLLILIERLFTTTGMFALAVLINIISFSITYFKFTYLILILKATI